MNEEDHLRGLREAGSIGSYHEAEESSCVPRKSRSENALREYRTIRSKRLATTKEPLSSSQGQGSLGSDNHESTESVD
jgi:hypothetical protein